MNEPDEALKRLLKRAAGPAADRQLQRDLWPDMARRLARPPVAVAVPWWDWALAAAVLLCLLFFPETMLAVLCQL